MAGWIKIYRDIQEHWIWQDSNKLKWWLDIILMANHKDNKFLLGNELFEVRRGEFHTSELKLAERWNVSKKSVRSFLELLEKDHMVELNKSKKGTTIKVSNYNDYQANLSVEGTTEVPRRNHEGTIKEPQENHEGTTEVPQRNHEGYTNKNEKNDKECIKNEEEGKKNDKKEKKETIKDIIDAYASSGGELNKTLFDFVEMRKEIKKKPTPRALKMILNKLDNLADDEYTKIKILEQSILHSWQDVYELKQNNNKASNAQGMDQKMQGLSSWLNGGEENE